MATDLKLCDVPTPLGPMSVAVSADGVVWTGDDPDGWPEGLGARPAPDRLPAIERDLAGYFAGRLQRFATPADLRLVTGGFAREVLRLTATVPYGELATYGDIASAAGRPGAARAAGTALRRCPIELFVPCHRIVPAGPGFGRYGGHEDRRLFLLRLEGAI